ncbi:pilus assembly protein PilM, partial [Legionella pneumophila]|uniref:pilus assembly protein PilM n=1 Tax=Legionella pneumophila TaxID=446 RepID=UPI001FF19602
MKVFVIQGQVNSISFNLFICFDGMRLIFSREEKFGGMQLVEAIAEHYHMNLEQAIALKNQGKL